MLVVRAVTVSIVTIFVLVTVLAIYILVAVSAVLSGVYISDALTLVKKFVFHQATVFALFFNGWIVFLIAVFFSFRLKIS